MKFCPQNLQIFIEFNRNWYTNVLRVKESIPGVVFTIEIQKNELTGKITIFSVWKASELSPNKGENANLTTDQCVDK